MKKVVYLIRMFFILVRVSSRINRTVIWM